MKFTVNTKPLKNVTNLGIIKANISRHYHRSSLVQITADCNTLKLNIEASRIKTEMTLHGSGDGDTAKSIIVECTKFKALLDSLDNDVTTLEFVDGGLCIHAGSSKFVIPQMLDVNDVQLDTPMDQYHAESTVIIQPRNWQFIKDHQMFALATKEERPVYRNVWVGADHDVIVGDMDLSLFTLSKRGDFGTSCLLPATLINLFASIPEGSTVSKVGRSYILTIATDSYSLVTEFTPKYEDDESVGSYSSEIIMSKLVHPAEYVTVDASPVLKFISQTALFRETDIDKALTFGIADGKLTLANKANTYSMSVATSASYSLLFNADLLKGVLSNLDSNTVNIAPMSDESGKVAGCIFWTDDLTAILAGTKLV